MNMKKDYLIYVLENGLWEKLAIYRDYDTAVKDYLTIAKNIADEGLGVVKLEMRKETKEGTAYDCLHFFCYQDLLNKK